MSEEEIWTCIFIGAALALLISSFIPDRIPEDKDRCMYHVGLGEEQRCKKPRMAGLIFCWRHQHSRE